MANSSSAGFNASPTFKNASSYSATWPSRDGPADDGNCGENIAVAVLTAFDIPITGNIPPRGNLCGIDINNMDAQSAIRLSLAENLALGKFIELYMNEFGQAYFQEVYPVTGVSFLDIRVCIPTSSLVQKTDLVIVRGYDKPPVRTFKNFYDIITPSNGSTNPDPVTVINSKQSYISLASQVGTDTCHGKMFTTEAAISYKDPVLETSYNDGVDNLYEIQAFENLIGYVIDFDGSSDPGVSYAFSDSTALNVEVSPVVNRVSTSTLCGTDINPAGLAGISLGNFQGTDKYGELWPLLNQVHSVHLSGYKILQIRDFSAFLHLVADSTNVRIVFVVNGIKQLVNLPAGSNWHWTLDANSGATIYTYYQVSANDASNTILSDYQKGAVPIRLTDGRTLKIISNDYEGALFPGINDVLGMTVEKMLVGIEIDRPSVVVTSPSGNALSLAKSLHVAYQPIIVIDEPPPVAYTFGGPAKLVNPLLDLYDTDPSTQQESPANLVGSMSWLQSQSVGTTVDISLPFATADECKEIANTIFNLQNEELTTYKLVCGPTSKPKLGTRVEGFSGRINAISYNYQDGSQYNISVDISSTFINVGGWGNSLWQIKTQDVSRKGIISWCAGDGVNYRVRVQGLGVYHAINKTLSAFNVGEKVSVTVHNLPQENL